MSKETRLSKMEKGEKEDTLDRREMMKNDLPHGLWTPRKVKILEVLEVHDEQGDASELQP